MADPVRVKVVFDDNGTLKPAFNANVSIVKRDEVGDLTWPYFELPFTHTHEEDGHYRHLSGERDKEPGPGEWLLVVSSGGDRSPVVQRLTFTDEGAVLRAAAGWGVPEKKQLGERAATVSIVNYDKATGAGGGLPAKQSLVTVRLLPRREIVGLACKDTHASRARGNTHYDQFAVGRRDTLFKDKKIDEGTLFTMFIVETRRKVVMVKSADPSPGSWVTVGDETPNPVAKGEKQPVVDKDISILDLYRHLHWVGKQAPGTVFEVGAYGHGWYGGPIVWDTADRAPSFTARDPNDFDARPKDWAPGSETVAAYPSMKAALSQEASFRSWGCTHISNVILEIGAAEAQHKAKTPRDKFFLINLENGKENATLDHVKRNIAQYVVSTRARRMNQDGDASGGATYGGVAARALSPVKVYAAPPGLGANFAQKGGVLFMHIADTGENVIPLAYYRREFSDAFEQDEHGYLNFTKMLGASLPDPGWATERWTTQKHPDYPGMELLRLPSGLEVLRKIGVGYAAPTATTFEGTSGHLYLAAKSRPSRVEQRGTQRLLFLDEASDQDTGIFVGKDGASILVKPAGASTPARNEDAIPVVEMSYRGGRKWETSANPPDKLTSGALESVTPGWFW